MMRTSTTGLLGLVLLCSTSTAAFAQLTDPPSEIEITGNAAVTTDYRFRGVSLSDGNVAAQGGIDVGHASGFYVGVWGSSLTSANETITLDDGTGTPADFIAGNFGAVEIDLYGGWSAEVASGLTFDAGIIYYAFPDADNTTTTTGAIGPSGLPIATGTADFDTDYWEPYASLAFALGPAEAKVGVNYAWEQDSLGNADNLYVFADLSSGIPDTPITVTGHVGYTDGALAPPLLAGSADDDGFDYSVAADLAVTEKLSVGVMYTGVDGPSIDDFTDDGFLATVSVSF